MSETNLIGIYYIASIVKIKKGIIAIGYKEGEVEVINVDDYDYPVLLGRFQCIYKNDIFSILSMAYITEGLISIETGTCVIEIWRIFDLDDKYNPVCICKMQGQKVTSIAVEAINGILYAGGRERTTKCYELVYTITGK